LFATGGVFGALGNIWVLITFLAGTPASVVAPAYFAFYAALVLGMAGIGSFPAVPRRGTDLARMILDGIIIAGSLFVVASVAVFPQLLAPSGGGITADTVLPVIDVAVASLAMLLILRVGRSDRPALALLSAGFTLYAGTDLTYAVLNSSAHPLPFGSPVDIGWITGYALIGLAALHPAAAAMSKDPQPKDASPTVGTILVFAILAGAAIVSMFSFGPLASFSLTSGLLWLILLLTIAARQVLLIVDNDLLRHGLERRVAERTIELRDLTRRSELLLSSVGEGIYGVDRAGLVTFVNPAGSRTLGYAADELIGQQAHAAFHAPQQDGTPFPLELCYVTEAIRDGTVTNAEQDVYRQANGKTFPVEVTSTPMANGDRVQGAVVVFRDITQRQEVDRLKSEFVSMVSHELRTPLTSIRGTLGLLAGGALGALPATVMRMIDLALDSCARLTRLINDILDIERIESGTMPMDVGTHRADDLIETATAQLQVLAAQVDVRLVISKAEGVVHADADRVVQTLINLLDNAIKFSPVGTTVDVSSHLRGPFVEFRISDQGRGIPEEKLESIFRRFEQVDSSDAREKGGSGLGLAISRSVIERLGGRIWAESVEGAGSTFRFTLPRSSTDQVTPATGTLTADPDTQRERHERQENPERATAGLP
jgi:PAS domain S-box-containing protein